MNKDRARRSSANFIAVCCFLVAGVLFFVMISDAFWPGRFPMRDANIRITEFLALGYVIRLLTRIDQKLDERGVAPAGDAAD
ncbi:hypothetical protein DMC25_15200 [Caulobacter sp. D4A]|uniref:hypothetical protein n=1 Tax=unclassified Caulobacter TaxID=2648921 RepID=UPI000D72762E|nr:MULTISPECIES: hypothetical protein [unclassified Caulobacter]PXA85550.1 hypothetical protein DMC25_15200 [Caulobacter sp. D4A]PXA94454.1 hypothetical protein DMC18_06305 [Caulobacter sp. D5]